MIRYLLFILLLFIACEQKTAIHNAPEADKLYDEGAQLLLKDNIEAYRKFQKALNYYYKTRDSSNISKSLICQAIAQKYTGDIFGAETTLVDALNFMKEGDESLYSAYNTLGDIKYAQKEYASAEEWYNKGLSEKNTSQKDKFDMLNNKGASEYRQKKYSSALKTLQNIDLSQVKDINLKNRIKENIVYTQWLQNQTSSFQSKFEELLNLKLKNNDYWGANSSYSHLAEINQENNPAISLYYAQKMLEVAKKLKSPDDRLEAIEKISLVDNPINSRKNFKQYKNLSDSIQNYKNDNRNRFAYIKYDSEKKEIDNQRLKADNSQKQINILLLIIALILAIIIIGWYRKRQIQLKQEKELEVKNTQLKMSKKVHDVVANGIYQVMTKIENQSDFDKDEALDELEFVYEKSRDISYEKEDTSDTLDFDIKVSTLISSFKSDEVHTFLAGNSKNIWDGVSSSAKDELFQVIRELLVNMKKHSQASRVAFKFERKDNVIHIQYTDDGVGIQGDISYNNGLSNTVSRIEKIHGKITFDTQTEKGLKVYISFPA
ncbi:ATP-binding protein [Chryseobacterium sp. JK1]|uniref:tetratricopeptide repeat-containing sensor histidine kinase n=1 Tax=Chryseobacterium sp. JK1 TaxID=874294 RepID=UPI003D69BBA3